MTPDAFPDTHGPGTHGPGTRAALEEVARTSYGRLLAHLAAGSRDLAAAEDALGDAVVAALRTWPTTGPPRRPEAWLLTTARRTLIDGARRRDVATRARPSLTRLTPPTDTAEAPAASADEAPIPDTRLELLFTCAHPAIGIGVRAPLMLQTVLGIDAARIASAFLVSPASMGQRLVRAKAKIKEAGIPFAVPGRRELPERLEFVLDAVYAAYGTGWDDVSNGRGLSSEALRLARLVADLLPDEPEARGLAAALLHGEARSAARRGPRGEFVPLDQQDVRLWDPHLMAAAEHHIAAAAAHRRSGPYQLHAAIQSVHNRRAVTGSTDWAAIAALYDRLVTFTSSVGAHVARAAAHMQAGSPTRALAVLDELDPRPTAGYQPYWVVRAHCLLRAGADPTHAVRLALGLTEDPALRAHLATTFTS